MTNHRFNDQFNYQGTECVGKEARKGCNTGVGKAYSSDVEML